MKWLLEQYMRRLLVHYMRKLLVPYMGVINEPGSIVLVFVSDTYILKVRKNYMDSRARKNLSSINTELQDVQRIMVQNIDDVLQRGDSLSGM